jgi:outer membrane immunogenic protein
VGGPQAGCDYQPSNQWIVGVIVSYDFADIDGSHFVVGPGLTPPSGVGHTFNEEITGFGSVLGRIGWLMAPSLLVYGSGGLAYGRILTNSQTGLIAGSFLDPGEANWKTCWTAGGGLEWKFSAHVSVFAEYMYAELGSVTGNGEFNPGFPGLAVTDSYGKPRINVMKAGFNWRY